MSHRQMKAKCGLVVRSKPGHHCAGVGKMVGAVTAGYDDRWDYGDKDYVIVVTVH